MKFTTMAAFLSWLVVDVVQAAENVNVLDELVFCLVCHGYQAQGNPSVGAPALVGIEDWYLDSALTAYREGTRTGYPAAMDMQAAARMLPAASNGRVRELLANVSAGERTATLSVDESRLEAGGQAYRQYCASCHGADAEGNQALSAPGLRRLNDWYLKSAWQAYLASGRGAGNDDSAAQMGQFARALPQSFDIDAVIAFLTRAE